METSHRKFTRLLDVLDDLVEREAIGVEARDFQTVTEVQRRAGPIVAGLAELGLDAADEGARARVAAVMARRQRSIDLIGAQLAMAQQELLELGEGARRAAQVGPVYGRAEGTPDRQRYRGRG